MDKRRERVLMAGVVQEEGDGETLRKGLGDSFGGGRGDSKVS